MLIDFNISWNYLRNHYILSKIKFTNMLRHQNLFDPKHSLCRNYCLFPLSFSTTTFPVVCFACAPAFHSLFKVISGPSAWWVPVSTVVPAVYECWIAPMRWRLVRERQSQNQKHQQVHSFHRVFSEKYILFFHNYCFSLVRGLLSNICHICDKVRICLT